MPKKGVKVLITGRVLGVNFRSRAQRKATQLKLTGYIKAMPNRTLEVFAEGQEQALQDFSKWLIEGPKHAEIEDTEVQWYPFEGSTNRFTIKYAVDEE